jgi:hypothetical protein
MNPPHWGGKLFLKVRYDDFTWYDNSELQSTRGNELCTITIVPYSYPPTGSRKRDHH